MNQLELEEMFNKKQASKLIKDELKSSKTIMKLVLGSGLPEDFALDVLRHMALFKTATFQQLAGVLMHHFITVQECVDALTVAVEKDLMDWYPKDEKFVSRISLDKKTHETLEQYQYLPPMVRKPRKLRTNTDSGYLSIPKDSVILQDNHHEGDLCLDHLNRFNRVELVLNSKMTETPMPEKDYLKRITTLFNMELIGDRTMWLTHKYDKRGRTYAQGYTISYQGTDYNKAVVEFANKQVVPLP